MAKLLRGSALITGAASGIGERTAHAFAKHGMAKIALADVNLSALETAASILKGSYPHVEVLALHVDVRNAAEIQGGISRVVKKFGRLDVAVNNAGIGDSGGRTHEIEDEEWDDIIDVNLRGVKRCQKEELAVMVRQHDLGEREGRGKIINVASILGLVGPSTSQHHTAYAAAKHAIVGMTKADANSYGADGIRINAICPGYVATPFLRRVAESPNKAAMQADIARSSLKRIASMDEIADCIVFLASPMSSFMQGAALVVDGGFTSN